MKHIGEHPMLVSDQVMDCNSGNAAFKKAIEQYARFAVELEILGVRARCSKAPRFKVVVGSRFADAELRKVSALNGDRVAEYCTSTAAQEHFATLLQEVKSPTRAIATAELA